MCHACCGSAKVGLQQTTWAKGTARSRPSVVLPAEKRHEVLPIIGKKNITLLSTSSVTVLLSSRSDFELSRWICFLRPHFTDAQMITFSFLARVRTTRRTCCANFKGASFSLQSNDLMSSTLLPTRAWYSPAFSTSDLTVAPHPSPTFSASVHAQTLKTKHKDWWVCVTTRFHGAAVLDTNVRGTKPQHHKDFF